MEGHKFLKVTGILMIIAAVFSIIAGVFVGGLGALAASAAGLVLHTHCGRNGLRDVDGQIPCVKYAAKNRAGKQASACAGSQ